MKPDTAIYADTLDDLREVATSKSEELTFAEVRVVAPKWMRSAVKRGKRIREAQPDSNKCCTPIGLRRANQIENGETLSLPTIKRMKSFAARHSGQASWNAPESKNAQGLLLWGVPYSSTGAKRFIAWCDVQISKLEKQ